MMIRALSLTLMLAVTTGCGAQINRPSTARPGQGALAASARTAPANILATYERKPSLGLVKPVLQLHAIEVDPMPGDAPLSIVKIQGLATAGLAEAELKSNWQERFDVTDATLNKIDDVKLLQSGLNNVPAKIGMYAANGYGYIGLRPTHENRYKVQAVTLAFLKANTTEPTLAKGSLIFSMSAQMIEATTGWDQGFKVGVSVLSTIRDNYKDKQITKSTQEVLDKACDAPSREEAYRVIVTGLKELAEKTQ